MDSMIKDIALAPSGHQKILRLPATRKSPG